MTANLINVGVLYGNSTLRTSGKWATKAIFAMSGSSGSTITTNLVNIFGGLSTDVTYTATDRLPSGAGYGGDKAIFGFGVADGLSSLSYNITNLVSNLGVIASDVTNSSNAKRFYQGSATYGGDKAIFGFGWNYTSSTVYSNVTTLISNTGSLASDNSGTGTGRNGLAAAGYGGDKAIFGFGSTGSMTNITNLVSNLGVVAADQAALTGTARWHLGAAGYGGDKAIFGFGWNGSSNINVTNLVSNTGVVATDNSDLIGSKRRQVSAAGYGGDKAIFGFGFNDSTYTNITNLVSNTGVVSSDLSGIGTARTPGASSYGS